MDAYKERVIPWQTSTAGTKTEAGGESNTIMSSIEMD